MTIDIVVYILADNFSFDCKSIPCLIYQDLTSYSFSQRFIGPESNTIKQSIALLTSIKKQIPTDSVHLQTIHSSFVDAIESIKNHTPYVRILPLADFFLLVNIA